MHPHRIVRPPTRVVGLGAPVSMLICLTRCEIAPLRRHILGWTEPAAAAERARRGETHSPDALRAWQEMLAELDRAARTPPLRAVLWPTVYSDPAFRGAIADTLAAGRSTRDLTARATAFVAVGALRRTLIELRAVDDGGLQDVWL
jgi:hypothetical protein